MNRKQRRIILIGALLIQYAGVAHAEETQDRQIEVLERQLRERDGVMLELLDRIEALEKRIGIASARQRPAEVARSNVSQPDSTQAIADGTISNAPGAIVVDARIAERALERSLSREGALLLPPGTLEIEPGFSFARAENSTSSFVMSGSGTVAAQTERNTNRSALNIAARLGMPWGSQLEIGVPYRAAQVENVTTVGFAPAAGSTSRGNGFGDLRVGLAKTLFRENLWRPDLVGRVAWDTDTGKTSDNGVSLGGGFHEVLGSLTAIKRQDPVVFIGGVSYQYSFESEQIQPGPVYAMNLGTAYALSPETSLRLGFSGGWQGETEYFGNQVDGSSRTFGTFLVGGSTLLAPGILLNTSLGIGLTGDGDDFSLSFSVPIRFQTPLF